MSRFSPSRKLLRRLHQRTPPTFRCSAPPRTRPRTKCRPCRRQPAGCCAALLCGSAMSQNSSRKPCRRKVPHGPKQPPGEVCTQEHTYPAIPFCGKRRPISCPSALDRSLRSETP